MKNRQQANSANLLNTLNNQHGGSTLIVLLLILILGVLLMATNPGEAQIRTKIAAELTPAGQVEALTDRVGEIIGTVKFHYNDYILCSTFTVEEKSGEEIVAVGVAGQVFTRNKLNLVQQMVKEKLDPKQ